MRPTTCTLSEPNLLHNLSVIRAAAPRAKIMGMVKANAYGHNIRMSGPRLAPHVDALGVASIDEALVLRQAGVTTPITLIEGVFEAAELAVASENRFAVVFHTQAQLDWLGQAKLARPVAAWLKIDTGMGRLGFRPEKAVEAMEILSKHPSIEQPFGILSHFARADEADEGQNLRQIAAFEKFAATHPGPKSLCNSAAIFSFPGQHHDWVRPGIALYGGAPVAGKTAAAIGLKPVMTFRTRLIAVKKMKKGDTLGYGARFTCPEDMPVGIMAAGYGDGYPRTAKDGTPILVEGRRCGIAGRVSMDMAAIDLRNCPAAKVGGAVTLWGEDLPVEDVAPHTAHINYDLLTGLQGRVRYEWADA